MDVRRTETAAVFRTRSNVLRAVRNFFHENGFVEINTSKIVATATEGGTELFPITYFEREAFLNQSPQLYKQMMMASGLDRAYEIAPIFRAEEHDTRRHLNEVTSIDVEVSFVEEHNDVMEILERLINYVYREIAGTPELKALSIELPIPELPFRRITYDEVISMLQDDPNVGDIEWGSDLDTACEKELGKMVGEHYFIIDWPTDSKPFYAMPHEDKPELSKSFDLMHPRMELASGAQRIHDYALLRERIEAKGLNPDSFDFYLKAFRYGMPPHAGWGLGAERLLMTMLNLGNIREAVLFPRDRRRLSP